MKGDKTIHVMMHVKKKHCCGLAGVDTENDLCFPHAISIQGLSLARY